MKSKKLNLDEFLPYRLNQIAEKVSLSFAEIYKAQYGMTRPEWRVLAIIGQEGEATARDIVVRSAMDRTKVSRAVAKLEKRDWLIRKVDKIDRRVEILSLTKTGRTAYLRLVDYALEFEAELMAEVGEVEARKLKRSLAILEAKFNSTLTI